MLVVLLDKNPNDLSPTLRECLSFHRDEDHNDGRTRLRSKSRLPPERRHPADLRRAEAQADPPPRRFTPEVRHKRVHSSSKRVTTQAIVAPAETSPPASPWARRHLPFTGRLQHVVPSLSTISSAGRGGSTIPAIAIPDKSRSAPARASKPLRSSFDSRSTL